jgi:hypothetical protein
MVMFNKRDIVMVNKNGVKVIKEVKNHDEDMGYVWFMNGGNAYSSDCTLIVSKEDRKDI